MNLISRSRLTDLQTCCTNAKHKFSSCLFPSSSVAKDYKYSGNFFKVQIKVKQKQIVDLILICRYLVAVLTVDGHRERLLLRESVSFSRDHKLLETFCIINFIFI